MTALVCNFYEEESEKVLVRERRKEREKKCEKTEERKR